MIYVAHIYIHREQIPKDLKSMKHTHAVAHTHKTKDICVENNKIQSDVAEQPLK